MYLFARVREYFARIREEKQIESMKYALLEDLIDERARNPEARVGQALDSIIQDFDVSFAGLNENSKDKRCMIILAAINRLKLSSSKDMLLSDYLSKAD